MFKFSAQCIATKASISAIVAVPVLAGLAAFLVCGMLEAKAAPKTQITVQQASAKSDSLTVRAKRIGCALRGWPNYEQGCQFDMRRPADEMRNVRIVALR